jgi:hypothetical protein
MSGRIGHIRRADERTSSDNKNLCMQIADAIGGYALVHEFQYLGRIRLSGTDGSFAKIDDQIAPAAQGQQSACT